MKMQPLRFLLTMVLGLALAATAMAQLPPTTSRGFGHGSAQPGQHRGPAWL
jgi:hypothetical protein